MKDTFDYFGKHPIPPTEIEVGASMFKEVRRIRISDITPNQRHVDEELIRKKMKGKQLTKPYVLSYRGKFILMDGHHTTIAKMLNGKKYIYAKYMEM